MKNIKNGLLILMCVFMVACGNNPDNGIDKKKSGDKQSVVSHSEKDTNSSNKAYTTKMPNKINNELKDIYEATGKDINADSDKYPNNRITLTGILGDFDNFGNSMVFMLINKSDKRVTNYKADVTIVKKSLGIIIFNKYQISFTKEEYGVLEPGQMFPQLIPFSEDKQFDMEVWNSSDFSFLVENVTGDFE